MKLRTLLSSMTVFKDSIHIGSMSPSRTIHLGPSWDMLESSLMVEEKRPKRRIPTLLLSFSNFQNRPEMSLYRLLRKAAAVHKMCIYMCFCDLEMWGTCKSLHRKKKHWPENASAGNTLKRLPHHRTVGRKNKSAINIENRVSHWHWDFRDWNKIIIHFTSSCFKPPMFQPAAMVFN